MFDGDILSIQTGLAVVFIGIIATAVGDLWNLLLLKLRVIPVLGWNYVGRWVLGCGSGQVYAPDLGSQPARRGEMAVGWVFHYAVGILGGFNRSSQHPRSRGVDADRKAQIREVHA